MKFTTYILIAMFALVSCDVIDQEPVSNISSINFFQTASDAEAAVIGVYDGFQGNGFVSMLYVLQPMVASDLTFPSRGGNYTRINTFAVTPTSNGDIRALWEAVYQGVHRCNDVLENVPNIEDPAIDDRRDRMLGEAYFIRAFHFWHMTRWFGKIPLPLETTKSVDNLNIPREELEVVYNQIISDLQQAEALLPEDRENRALASKGAAQALMARVFLFRNGEGDYANAAAKTTEIIQSGAYDLVAGENFASLFRVGAQNTVETIFEISVRP
ncbi:MAG: RagB/SusD family nutrient uptake outer membrane protein, partial [Pricia sp.]